MCVPGIEITAVLDGRDVHVLGYCVDGESAALDEFLVRQRADRVSRVRAMAARLARLGMPLDVDRLIAPAAAPGRSIGRPNIARAMVEAGYAIDMDDAFRLWLGAGRPAFEPRCGRSPAAVVAIIAEAGGVSSLAHPGVTGCDEAIPSLAEAGLDALEAYHSDHSDQVRSRYAALASSLGLLITGGSDFHGDGTRRAAALGSVGTPPDAFEQLMRRAQQRSEAH